MLAEGSPWENPVARPVDFAHDDKEPRVTSTASVHTRKSTSGSLVFPNGEGPPGSGSGAVSDSAINRGGGVGGCHLREEGSNPPGQLNGEVELQVLILGKRTKPKNVQPRGRATRSVKAKHPYTAVAVIPCRLSHVLSVRGG